MADKKTKENKKEKRPSALKRDIQSEKRRLHNKQFRATVKTAIKSYEASLKGNEASAQENLSKVFSLMDKGVKTGVFKQNKADRTKSRLATKA